MVENQVRTNDVTDLAVQDAMRDAPRERLCGPKTALAYAEAPVEYAPGWRLAEPRNSPSCCRRISPQPGERALAIAAPYAALVLARVGCTVTALQPPGPPRDAVAPALAEAGVTVEGADRGLASRALRRDRLRGRGRARAQAWTDALATGAAGRGRALAAPAAGRASTCAPKTAR